MINDLEGRGITIYGEIRNKYKAVVPLSGGKDSQACLILALGEYKPNEILALFCDTDFEHPITYCHVADVVEEAGIDLIILASGSVLEVCTKYKRFPGGGARHCTDELKIRPSKFFYEWLAKKQGDYDVWYGMRSEESTEREERYKGKISEDLYDPHEIMDKYPKKLGKLGVKFKLPVIDWTKKEIFNLLNGKENPLYSMGFDRVGCFPCLAGGEAHQMRAFYFDEIGKNHYKIAEKISVIADRPVLVTKKYLDQGPGCSLCCI